MKSNRKIIGLIVIIIAILLVVGFVVTSISKGMSVSSGGNAFQCRVILDGDVFSDTDIKAAECEYTGKECSSFANLFVFGFFEDEGVVKFVGSDGITYARETYKVEELGDSWIGPIPIDSSKDVEVILHGCTDVTSGKIVVISNDKGEQDTESVIFQ